MNKENGDSIDITERRRKKVAVVWKIQCVNSSCQCNWFGGGRNFYYFRIYRIQVNGPGFLSFCDQRRQREKCTSNFSLFDSNAMRVFFIIVRTCIHREFVARFSFYWGKICCKQFIVIAINKMNLCFQPLLNQKIKIFCFFMFVGLFGRKTKWRESKSTPWRISFPISLSHRVILWLL